MVSKLLPEVLMVVLPVAVAVQDHQTEERPMTPAGLGSPVSRVA